MYTPLSFKNENTDELKQFIKDNNFGLLISEINSKPWATHLPFVINPNTNTLSAHLSRGNRQWKQLSENKEVLVVFQGPHSYISSTWYDHENVPTYNYIAVHVYGQPRIIEGEELVAHLKQLVNHHEQHSQNPASVERMTPSYLQREIKGIVALEIKITSIEASYKLSQNRDEVNHKNIINELEKEDDNNAAEIAKAMRVHGHK